MPNMMKTYFLIKPSEFTRLGDIDWDGNVKEIQCENFKVPDERENVLIFEAYYDGLYSNGDKNFVPYVIEFVSGRKFNLELFYSKKNGTRCLNISSEELGLYMQREIPIKEVEVSPLKVSGLLMYLEQRPEESGQYFYELREMFEIAQAFQHIYLTSVDGPSKFITKRIRNGFKKRR